MREGPFYPVEPIPLRSDLIADAKVLVGSPIQLDGRILDQQGKPLAGARIEIWQCDGHGIYEHPSQSGREKFDPGFTGFGAQVTDEQGYYRFTTLYPVPYTGRPPHIHVKIRQGQQEKLTTQLYLEGNTGSSWFSSGRDALQINPKPSTDGILQAQFTFIV